MPNFQGLLAAQGFRMVTATNVNVLTVKAEQGVVTSIIANGGAAAMFIKLYDAATAASVTVGTTVPTYTIPVPSAGLEFALSVPLAFVNGIQMTVTNLVADSDATNPATTGLPVQIGFA